MQGTVAVSLLDGTKQEAKGPVFTQGDRIAFERQFSIPAVKLAELERLFDKKGKLREGADISGFREEWLVFFAYRALVRAEQVSDDYEAWLEKIDDLEFEMRPDEAANPTAEAPQLGASQS
jgi:hypothetical protein